MLNPNPMNRLGNVQDGGLTQNQDNLEVCHHHSHHHTFMIRSYYTPLTILPTAPKLPNIPTAIILSSFSNGQILTGWPLQGPGPLVTSTVLLSLLRIQIFRK